MGAQEIAEALELTPSATVEAELCGVREGVAIGLIATAAARGTRASIRLFAQHSLSLRAGLLVETRSAVTGADRLPGMPELRTGDRRLDRAVTVRACEATLVVAIVRECADAIADVLEYGDIEIDDQRIWMTCYGPMPVSRADLLYDQIIALSRTLATERVEWEPDFESQIEPVWSALAAAEGLAWDPDRSMMEGQLPGVAIELRVDGQPGLLYTEMYAEWQSLALGLSIEREKARGTRGGAAPARDDLDAVDDMFNRDFLVRASERAVLDEGIPSSVLHAALTIASTGASLTIDDTGLVARVDRVVDDADTLAALVLGAIAIARGLAAREPPRGAYR